MADGLPTKSDKGRVDSKSGLVASEFRKLVEMASSLAASMEDGSTAERPPEGEATVRETEAEWRTS